jgi:folate-dependent phosphoribosylglycinamide formyltransferase PurN
MLMNRVAGRLIGWPFVRAWHGTLGRYRREYPTQLAAETIRVANVNASETLAALRRQAPDMVVVSGTNIVGKEIITEAQRGSGIVNLHTGISPYVKGGPNCTNWCLATGQFSLIGNSVMWLDSGIDTGPLIATERTPLCGTETLSELHWKVMEHAHDLCVRALAAIRDGLPVCRIPQDEVGEGRTFYNADWTAFAQARAYLTFLFRYSPAGLLASLRENAAVRLVSLPAGGLPPTHDIGDRPTDPASR